MKNSARIESASLSILFAGICAAALSFSGCATTQQVAVSAPSGCPFLGPTLCAKLTPSERGNRFFSSGGAETERAALSYINPDASFASYSKILLAPVTFWGGDDTTVSPSDQHQLVDFLQQALAKQLATKFKLVRVAGPGTMTLQVAIIDSESATPVLRTISMLIPQARALATLKYLATGTYPFVGSAEAELKAVDSVTHQVLGAAVDKRVGGGALSTAAQWQWGDAENAMTAWSNTVTARLAQLRAGGK